MKNIFKKIGGLCLGLAMLSGVAVGISSGKVQEINAATASVGTVLWGEDFSHFGTNTPSAAGTGSGTTIYDSASISYEQSNTNTKAYNESSAGGTAPELLLSKSNQTWTISGIKSGEAKEINLVFLSNKTTFSLTCSSTNYTVTGSGKSWTLTLGTGKTAPSTFNLTLKNTGSSNARIDNVVLKVTKAGGGTDPAVSIDENSTTKRYIAPKNGSISLTATKENASSYTATWTDNLETNKGTFSNNGQGDNVTYTPNSSIAVGTKITISASLNDTSTTKSNDLSVYVASTSANSTSSAVSATEAAALANSGCTASDFFVKGFVTKVDTKNLYIWISDTKGGSNTFEIYNSSGIVGSYSVDNYVVAHGKLKLFSTTPEIENATIDSNNYVEIASTLEVVTGKTAQLNATNATDDVSWTTTAGTGSVTLSNQSNTGVTVTGSTAGQATVTATVGSYSTSCTVTVSVAPESITLSFSEINTFDSYSYKEMPSITVNPSGASQNVNYEITSGGDIVEFRNSSYSRIYLKGTLGTATVSISSAVDSEVKATLTINVAADTVSNIRVKSGSTAPTQYIGEKLDITGMEFEKYFSEKKSWADCDLSDITVSNDEITSSTTSMNVYYKNTSVSCPVTVGTLKNPSVTINGGAASLVIYAEDEGSFTVVTEPSGKTVKWSSSDENIIIVDEDDGSYLAGDSTGTATITATYKDGIYDTIEVEVKEKTIVSGNKYFVVSSNNEIFMAKSSDNSYTSDEASDKKNFFSTVTLTPNGKYVASINGITADTLSNYAWTISNGSVDNSYKFKNDGNQYFNIYAKGSFYIDTTQENYSFESSSDGYFYIKSLKSNTYLDIIDGTCQTDKTTPTTKYKFLKYKEFGTLTSITVDTANSKTKLFKNDTLTANDIKVFGIDESGLTKTITTGVTLSGYSATTLGIQTVTVNASEKQTTFSVEVIDRLNSIKSSGVPVDINYEELFNSVKTGSPTITKSNITLSFSSITAVDTSGKYIQMAKSSKMISSNAVNLIKKVKFLDSLSTASGCSISLYGSTDGNSWNAVKSDISVGTSASDIEIELPSSVSYTYIKLEVGSARVFRFSGLILTVDGTKEYANTNFMVQKSIIEFANYCNNQLSGVCNSGVSVNYSSTEFVEAWSNCSTKYTEIYNQISSDTDKEYFNNMLKYGTGGVWTAGDATWTSEGKYDVLQRFLKTYDTVTSRSSNTKFLTFRTASAPSSVVSLFGNIVNSNSATWIIVVVSLVGLTAIGGYFFYKKRKENI